jgi:hypothetical protein
MESNPFVGTWRLVSFVRRDAEGKVAEPFGPGRGVSGYIIYAADGHMRWR